MTTVQTEREIRWEIFQAIHAVEVNESGFTERWHLEGAKAEGATLGYVGGLLRAARIAVPDEDMFMEFNKRLVQQQREAALGATSLTSPAATTPGIVAFIEARRSEWEANAREIREKRHLRLIADELAGRLLADAAKDRAILALHRSVADEHHHAWCAEDGRRYPCQTVRLLAAIDADHESYRPEWKPVAG